MAAFGHVSPRRPCRAFFSSAERDHAPNRGNRPKPPATTLGVCHGRKGVLPPEVPGVLVTRSNGHARLPHCRSRARPRAGLRRQSGVHQAGAVRRASRCGRRLRGRPRGAAHSRAPHHRRSTAPGAGRSLVIGVLISSTGSSAEGPIEADANHFRFRGEAYLDRLSLLANRDTSPGSLNVHFSRSVFTRPRPVADIATLNSRLICIKLPFADCAPFAAVPLKRYSKNEPRRKGIRI